MWNDHAGKPPHRGFRINHDHPLASPTRAPGAGNSRLHQYASAAPGLGEFLVPATKAENMLRLRTAVWTITGVVAVGLLVASAGAGDWPMWRGDAGRTGATPHGLPDSLTVRWTRQLAAPRPAWPASQPKLQYDVSYEPIVVGKLVIVGSMVDDSITAYSTEDGGERWRFFTSAPVRFAPASDGQRVFAVSDDGYLYALAADSGQLLWKVNGGPSERPILGQDRLVSTWPARGGAVVSDGVVYFSASIWPSMGIFVHAIDAETGTRIWTNSELGELFVVHPHGASSFGSIAPQGYLAVAGDYVVVPGGRTPPAILDRATGKLVHFAFRGKGEGDYGVMAVGDSFILNNQRHALQDSAPLGSVAPGVFWNGYFVGLGSSGKISATSLEGTIRESEALDRRGEKYIKKEFTPARTWELKLDGPSNVRLVAGDKLFAVDRRGLAAYNIAGASEAQKSEERPAIWTAPVEGKLWSLVAGDEKLLAVTEEGVLICYGAPVEQQPKHYPLHAEEPQPASAPVSPELAALAKQANAQAGYGIVVGIGNGRLIDELLRATDLHVIAIDADPQQVENFQRRMAARGWYGTRVSARAGDARRYPFPPYLSQLTLIDEGQTVDRELIEHLYRSLRPYGGTLAWKTESESAASNDLGDLKDLPRAKRGTSGTWSLVAREGSLPGSAPWTHQYADAANSVVSQDILVKAPLGVLWFGGPSNDKVLPRHGHGPSPQVAGGRLVIEGADMLRAVDVYTGRLLWERDLPGVGKYYDNTSHFPGAGEIGSNYVTTVDRVYVVHGPDLLELDAATGETVRTFREQDDQGQPATWGYLAVSGERLIATSTPVKIDEEVEQPAGVDQALAATQYASASKRLLVFDLATGKRLWDRVARFSFRHNSIAAAQGKIFAIDGMSPAQLQTLKRRGIEAEGEGRLVALDDRTGREIWSTQDDVFGTFLNYAEEHDVLLQAGSAYRDRAKDEVGQGMVAYRGADGKVLWKQPDLKYGGPCLLWRDKIITNGGGGFQLDLLTGESTGWTYTRMYGCNTAIGSQHLLTFRSGAAGYYDLDLDSGTGNIGGFRSSCTANLIPADGVLNAPDYTRTCTCAYQNQVSLALIHMPEAETWTFQPAKSNELLSDRLGLNLGAPGDRRDESGTLWLEYPEVGGPSPQINVKIEPSEVDWFRRHSSLVTSERFDWVSASGGQGIRTLSLKLDNKSPRKYTVRLHFAEPDVVKAGDRVFSVALQGKAVLNDLDVTAAAGGPNQGMVREFSRIEIGQELRVEFKASSNSKLPPLLCGLELVAESP